MRNWAPGSFYRDGLRFLAGLHDAGDLLVEQALLAIGQGREVAIHDVQLFFAQRVAQLLAALLQSMPAAVLSQHQLAFRHAHRLRVDDLVGGLFLEVAVLVDTGFVRERVAADNGFVRLWSERDDRAQHLARRVEVLGVDAGLEGEAVIAGLDRHDDLLERAVAGALADAVDGAFDLPRPCLHGGDGIGYRQPQIVVTVHADHGAIAQRLHDGADHGAIFVRRGEAYRVRNVDGPRASGDHGFGDFFQKLRLGAGAVLGRKLHVVYVVPRELYRRHRFVEHLVLGLSELV